MYAEDLLQSATVILLGRANEGQHGAEQNKHLDLLQRAEWSTTSVIGEGYLMFVNIMICSQ